jgi:hypothetical protein
MTDFLDRYGDQLRTAKLPRRRRALRRGFLASLAVLAVAGPTVALTAPDRTPREATFSVLQRPQTEADRRAAEGRVARGARDIDEAGIRAVGDGYVLMPVGSMEGAPDEPYLCLSGGGGGGCTPADRAGEVGVTVFSGDAKGSRHVGVVPDGVARVRFVPEIGTPTQVDVTGNFYNLYVPGDQLTRRIPPPAGWQGPRGEDGLIASHPVPAPGRLDWLDAQGRVVGPSRVP